MPQQFFTNDFIGAAAPIRQSISSAAGNLGNVAQAGVAMASANKQTENEQAANMADFEAVKRLADAAGVNADWNTISPRPNETNAQYRERLKVETLPIGQQLQQKGVDMKQLVAATKVPGIMMDTVTKLIQKQTGRDLSKQLSGGVPPEAQAAIQAGEMSPDQINKTYGTNMTEGDYNKYAGIAEPNPAFQHKPGTADFRQAARADQPIAPPPQLSYAQGRALVDNADLPADQKKTFDPQLQTLADREASKLITPGQTTVGYYGGMQGQGLPLTPMAEKIGGAYKDERLAALKERAQKLQGSGQSNARLRTLLQDAQFRARMKRSYSNDQVAMSDRLYELTIQREKLDNDLTAAMNYISTDPSKPAPDPQSIMDQMVIIDNEIGKLRGQLPDLQREEENFSYPNRTTIIPPREVTPGQPPKQSPKPNDPLGVR